MLNTEHSISEEVQGTILALALHWKNNFLVSTTLGWKKNNKQHIFSEKGEQALQCIYQYEQGKQVSWDFLPLAWGTIKPFQKKLLMHLQSVAYGSTVTYGYLAKQAGFPQAPRAVGQSMAKNPWPLVIPCHRVISKDKKLTGYTGEGSIEMKEWLLCREGHTSTGSHKNSVIITKNAT